MMQKRSLIVLVSGLVIALLTALSLSHRMHQPQGPAATQVMVAATDIPAGSFVRAGSDLSFADWPRDNISATMLTNQQSKTTDFEGSVARRAISKGEPITKNLLVRSNEGGFMSAVLDPGKRAVSIAVDSTTGNAGFIFPGDQVDLILTHSVTNGSEPAVRASETFIEDVRVLAVDQMLNNPDNKAVLAKTVTLEVTPKQAEEINVAKDLGKISLSLRALAAHITPPVTAPGGPQDLDDVLRETEHLQPNDHISVTRDTDVSKIIAPGSIGPMKVRVLRGNKEDTIDFSGGVPTSSGNSGNSQGEVRHVE